MNNPTNGTDKLGRIRVGNLAAAVTEVHLRALFLAYGRILSYERPVDVATGRPGAFAYIEMASAEGDAAVAALNGHQAGGRPLEISALRRVARWAPEADRHPRSPQLRRTVLPRPVAPRADAPSA